MAPGARESLSGRSSKGRAEQGGTGLEKVERYARGRYRHWDQRWLSHREQHLVDRLFRRYHLHGSILDAPVGYGRFLALLGGYGPVYALDANFYAVLYQLRGYGLARGSVNGLAEALPFRDHSFDIVFSVRLLQHIHGHAQRLAIFRELKRVSRSWVVVSLYLSSPVHRLFRRVVKQPSRITMLTRQELAEEARAAGLRLQVITSVLPGLHAHRICLFTTH